MTTKRPTHCYVGRCEICGAIQASCYDMRDKDTGRAVAEMIEYGLIVERAVLGTYRLSDCSCPQTVQESFA